MTTARRAADAARPERASRPILLTVDDDPSVSRAVARDLRRRYGADYRIVRADSGAEALEAIREVVLRGEQVAAILADYRMPRMNGIDFLEQAMDLVPQARRALLTAYADTNAAIAAINVVDVDHYLLKPWEPPEEKLYPVVDELLGDLAARGAGRPSTRSRSSAIRGRRPRTRCATSWPATRCPTAGTTSTSPRAQRLLAAAGAEAEPGPGGDHHRRAGAGPAQPARSWPTRSG